MTAQELKELLEKREKAAVAEVERAVKDWPLVTWLMAIRQFRLAQPHISTTPNELENLLKKEFRRAELAAL